VEVTNKYVGSAAPQKVKAAHVSGAFNWAAPNVLKKLVGTCNNSVNSATGLTPNKASRPRPTSSTASLTGSPTGYNATRRARTSNIDKPTYQ